MGCRTGRKPPWLSVAAFAERAGRGDSGQGWPYSLRRCGLARAVRSRPTTPAGAGGSASAARSQRPLWSSAPGAQRPPRCSRRGRAPCACAGPHHGGPAQRSAMSAERPPPGRPLAGPLPRLPATSTWRRQRARATARARLPNLLMATASCRFLGQANNRRCPNAWQRRLAQRPTAATQPRHAAPSLTDSVIDSDSEEDCDMEPQAATAVADRAQARLRWRQTKQVLAAVQRTGRRCSMLSGRMRARPTPCWIP